MAGPSKFNPSDLMVDIQPAGHDDLGQQKLAAKDGKQAPGRESTLLVCLNTTNPPATQTTFNTDLVLKTSSFSTKHQISQLLTQSTSAETTPPSNPPTGQRKKYRGREDWQGKE
jgi:hypothetical protein